MDTFEDFASIFFQGALTGISGASGGAGLTDIAISSTLEALPEVKFWVGDLKVTIKTRGYLNSAQTGRICYT